MSRLERELDVTCLKNGSAIHGAKPKGNSKTICTEPLEVDDGKEVDKNSQGTVLPSLAFLSVTCDLLGFFSKTSTCSTKSSSFELELCQIEL